jgi:hypothetical protein
MTFWEMPRLPVIAAVAAVAVAGAATAVWWKMSHRKSPEEIERERREHLVLHGRIIDGTILDWTEQPETGGPRALLYRYDIAGVTYECAQDLSYMKEKLTIGTSCLGMPASIRYDSKNPANSIILAESWSGIRNQNSAAG